MPITGKQISDGAITSSKLSGTLSAQGPRVVDKDLVTAPGSTTVGDLYILAGIGGNWSGGAVDDLAEALDTSGTLWGFITPTEGFKAWVLDEDAEYVYNGTIWQLHQYTNSTSLSVILGTTSGNFPASIIAGAVSNIVLGVGSAPALNIGAGNILVGNTVGALLTDGSGNIMIGATAGASLTTGTNNILIGGSADTPAAATANHLNLADTIFGDIVTKEIRIGGSGVPTAGVTLELENTAPLLRLFETGAAVDEKNYDIKMSGGALVVEALPDDLGSGSDVITVSRTGTVIDAIALGDVGVGDGFTFFFGQADNADPMLLVENAGTDGAAFKTFTGDVTPIGSVTGEPGDLYVQSRAGVSSTTYQHKGASANNTDWFILGPGLIQTDFTDLAVDVTTTATSFVSPSTLLTTTITKRLAASNLIVHFSVGASNSNNGRQMFFRVVVDGVPQRAVGVDCPNLGFAQGAAIVTSVSGVAAGSRTILIEWYRSANTGQVRPVTAPDSEHASMLVEEVLA